MDKELFRKDPRSFALELVENGLVRAEDLLMACVTYMSTNEVQDMLDANELSPRFDEHDDWFAWDEDDGQPSEAQEWYDYDADC